MPSCHLCTPSHLSFILEQPISVGKSASVHFLLALVYLDFYSTQAVQGYSSVTNTVAKPIGSSEQVAKSGALNCWALLPVDFSVS